MIANCGHDENGKYRNGKAGDQTGTEWQIRSWYNRPWNCVLRYPDLNVLNLIAELAREAAENNRIGYDQNERGTFWTELKKADYRPKNIKTNCEADCSSGTAAIVKAVGYLLDMDTLKNVSKDSWTGNMRSGLKNAGFTVLTDSKYLKSDKYLLPGDILLNDNAHVCINLDGKMSKKYVDVSNHRPIKDWAAVKYQSPFLISKATEGTSFVDGTLKAFVSGCEKHKIPYYLYTYLRKGNELEQTKYMVKNCQNLVGDMFRGYVLDVEEDNASTNVEKALRYLESLPYKVGLYTGYSKYDKYKNLIATRAEKTFWWEAIYGKNNGNYSSNYPPHDGVDLHQYTDKGEYDGIASECDLNRCVGKKEAWFLEALNEKSTENNASEKDIVKALQSAMNAAYSAHGLNLKVDGIFGNNTKKAVDKFYLCYQIPNIKNAHVSWMQEALNMCGADLTVDGKYGRNTDKAVTEFQRKNKLTVDGLAGVQTHTKLIEMVCR